MCKGARVRGSEARGRGAASHGPHGLLVPGPCCKAGEKTKAKAQTGTQISLPRPLLSELTSQSLERAFMLALGSGQQGGPGAAGQSPNSLPKMGVRLQTASPPGHRSPPYSTLSGMGEGNQF